MLIPMFADSTNYHYSIILRCDINILFSLVKVTVISPYFERLYVPRLDFRRSLKSGEFAGKDGGLLSRATAGNQA